MENMLKVTTAELLPGDVYEGMRILEIVAIPGTREFFVEFTRGIQRHYGSLIWHVSRVS